MKRTVKITIEGYANTGRTAVAVALQRLLQSKGNKVAFQDPDGQTWEPNEETLNRILRGLPEADVDFEIEIKHVKRPAASFDPNPNKIVPDALGSLGTKEPVAVAETKPDWTPDQPLSGEPHVVLETTHGRIVLELFPDKAPQTVANFLQYVKDGFYDGVIFHRVIPGFMIQGGGFKMDRSGEGKGKLNQQAARAPVPNEANNGLKNDRYSLAMARTNEINSGASQFFINVADNAFLNFTAPNARGFGYAVFGQVVVGANVVDLIAKQKTGRVGFHDDVPVEDVIITSARLIGG